MLFFVFFRGRLTKGAAKLFWVTRPDILMADRKRKRCADGDHQTGHAVNVRGMSYDTTIEQLRGFFKECGSIKWSCAHWESYLHFNRSITLPTWPDNRLRSKGFAVVTFDDFEGASNAVNVSGDKLLSRCIAVSLVQQKPTKQQKPTQKAHHEPTPRKTQKPKPKILPLSVFVGNMTMDTDEDALFDIFKGGCTWIIFLVLTSLRVWWCEKYSLGNW